MASSNEREMRISSVATWLSSMLVLACDSDDGLASLGSLFVMAGLSGRRSDSEVVLSSWPSSGMSRSCTTIVAYTS